MMTLRTLVVCKAGCEIHTAAGKVHGDLKVNSLRAAFDRHARELVKSGDLPDWVEMKHFQCIDVALKKPREDTEEANEKLWTYWMEAKRDISNRDNLVVKKVLSDFGGTLPSGKGLGDSFWPALRAGLHAVRNKKITPMGVGGSSAKAAASQAAEEPEREEEAGSGESGEQAHGETVVEGGGEDEATDGGAPLQSPKGKGKEKEETSQATRSSPSRSCKKESAAEEIPKSYFPQCLLAMIDSGVLSHTPQAALDYAIRRESTGSSNLPNVPLNRNEMDKLGSLQKKARGEPSIQTGSTSSADSEKALQLVRFVNTKELEAKQTTYNQHMLKRKTRIDEAKGEITLLSDELREEKEDPGTLSPGTVERKKLKRQALRDKIREITEEPMPDVPVPDVPPPPLAGSVLHEVPGPGGGPGDSEGSGDGDMVQSLA